MWGSWLVGNHLGKALGVNALQVALFAVRVVCATVKWALGGLGGRCCPWMGKAEKEAG